MNTIRVRVWENRFFRRIFKPTTEKVTEGWTKFHNKELLNHLYQILDVQIMKNEIDRVSSMHGMRTKFYLESLKGNHSYAKMDFKKYDVTV
jgi:hypothetical protein